MRHLILIRHSISVAQPSINAQQWRLSVEGQTRCELLAQQLKAYTPTRIVSSVEAKAQQTAQLVAQHLGIIWETQLDLHETERSTSDFFTDHKQFVAQVKIAMSQPDQIIFGSESFAAARQRFLKRVDILLKQYPDETLAIVTHGRVMATTLGYLAQHDAFNIWEALEMPAYAIFSLPDQTILRIVNTVEAQ